MVYVANAAVFQKVLPPPSAPPLPLKVPPFLSLHLPPALASDRSSLALPCVVFAASLRAHHASVSLCAAASSPTNVPLPRHQVAGLESADGRQAAAEVALPTWRGVEELLQPPASLPRRPLVVLDHVQVSYKAPPTPLERSAD